MQALFFLFVCFLNGARRLGFISFSVLFYRVTKSFSTYFENLYYGYNEGLFLLSSYVVLDYGSEYVILLILKLH